MNKHRKWGVLLIAWLGLCLMLLLAACSVLQKTGEDRVGYRVTVTLAAGSSEGAFVAALHDQAVADMELKPYSDGYDEQRRLNGSRIVIVTLPDELSVQQFRQNLLTAGVPLQSFQVQRLN